MTPETLTTEALRRAERKLTAYVGVCKDDKELRDSVLPLVRRALALPETPTEENFLTVVDKAELRALLGRFQDHLESSIIGALVAPLPTEENAWRAIILGGPVDDIDEVNIAQDRADWRAAEEWVKRLEAGQ